jgi:hypothetical protein
VDRTFATLQAESKQFQLVKLLEEPIQTASISEVSVGFRRLTSRHFSNSEFPVFQFQRNVDEVSRRILDCPARQLMVQFASDWS